MFSLRAVVYALFALSLIACGKNKAESKLQGLENFNNVQLASLTLGVRTFNKLVGRDVVDPQNNGYIINVEVKSQDELNAIEPKAGLFNPRYGYAIETYDNCSIVLSEEILKASQSELANTVIAHELGHCMGMKHEDQDYEIMSPSVRSLIKYSPTALENFSHRVRQILWLEKRDEA